jgi:hypothetical protein
MGKIFSLLQSVQTGSVAQPSSHPMETGTSVLVVKLPEREADLSLPSSAEAKNDGAIPPIPYTSLWLGS